MLSGTDTECLQWTVCCLVQNNYNVQYVVWNWIINMYCILSGIELLQCTVCRCPVQNYYDVQYVVWYKMTTMYFMLPSTELLVQNVWNRMTRMYCMLFDIEWLVRTICCLLQNDYKFLYVIWRRLTIMCFNLSDIKWLQCTITRDVQTEGAGDAATLEIHRLSIS